MINPNHVYTTGMGKHGQLGLGDLEGRMSFTHVKYFKDKNVSEIFAGGHHSWFMIDKENPIIENYEPPSPVASSPITSRRSSVSKKKKSKNFLTSSNPNKYRSKLIQNSNLRKSIKSPKSNFKPSKND